MDTLSRNQVNSSATSLLALPNSKEFRRGVELMRHVCAASAITFPSDAEAFASGLLVAADNLETQRGIVALAVMLNVNPDILVSVVHSIRACMAPQIEPETRVLIE
jgi:hypothetical protein